MPTATQSQTEQEEQRGQKVTFNSRSENQILTRRPPRNELNEFGQKTVITEQEWFDRQRESGEDFDDTPWKVEFTNYIFQTDHPKLIRWLRQHDKLGVDAPSGFWEVPPTEDELRPTTAERHLEIAKANGDTDALYEIRDNERDTHNRSSVIEAAEMAISVAAEGSQPEADAGSTGDPPSTSQP